MISIDGLELPLVKPATVAELCEIVKAQRAKREAVYPVGGRTMLDFGLPPVKPGVAVDVTGLDAVIDYPARDMTITVQAGITFAKLQATLAAENQWLPLDVPDPERMTIGGLIAANVSGPRRYGYGTLRDYVIGISFVSDDGKEIKGGGRVVKNVAGYDLMKLHIGALGTMGVITQVTLKVKPKSEARADVLTVNMHTDEPADYLKRIFTVLQSTKSSPVAVECGRIHNAYGGFTVGFEGKREVLEWQRSQLKSELEAVGVSSRSLIVPENDPWQKRHIPEFDKNSYITKLVTPPHTVLDVLGQLSFAYIWAAPMNGVIYVHSAQPVTVPDNVTSTVTRAPTAWKTPERIFGKPTPAWELMAHIKRTLDPDDVFNPGRMFTFNR